MLDDFPECLNALPPALLLYLQDPNKGSSRIFHHGWDILELVASKHAWEPSTELDQLFALVGKEGPPREVFLFSCERLGDLCLDREYEYGVDRKLWLLMRFTGAMVDALRRIKAGKWVKFLQNSSSTFLNAMSSINEAIHDADEKDLNEQLSLNLFAASLVVPVKQRDLLNLIHSYIEFLSFKRSEIESQEPDGLSEFLESARVTLSNLCSSGIMMRFIVRLETRVAFDLDDKDGNMKSLLIQWPLRESELRIFDIIDVHNVLSSLYPPALEPTGSKTLFVLVYVFTSAFRNIQPITPPVPIILNPSFLAWGAFHAIIMMWTTEFFQGEEMAIFCVMVTKYLAERVCNRSLDMAVPSFAHAVGFVKAFGESMSKISSPELRELTFYALERFLDLLSDLTFSASISSLLTSCPFNLRAASIQLLKNSLSSRSPFSRIHRRHPTLHVARPIESVKKSLEKVFDVGSDVYIEGDGGEVSEMAWMMSRGSVVNSAANLLVFLLVGQGKEEVQKAVPKVGERFVDALGKKMSVAMEEAKALMAKGQDRDEGFGDINQL
ncbi:hypothetical protein HDU67_001080, partial [Dinochytrium kinnereticum]